MSDVWHWQCMSCKALYWTTPAGVRKCPQCGSVAAMVISNRKEKDSLNKEPGDD